MGNDLFIKSVETKYLGQNELLSISQIQKDMWAYSLGEYVRCNCCKHIHSKNDIFGHLSQEIRKESVTKLEGIFLGDSIKCQKCNSGNTEFIYDIDKNLKIFMDRYKKLATLVLSFDHTGEIIGFCDGYISTINDIYNSDLSYHYDIKDINFLFDMISLKLPIKRESLFLYFSSLGTYERYINYNFIYELLRVFFLSIDFNDENLFGITELDKNNSLYKIYKMMGSISIGIQKDLIKDTQENYDSDIVVFPNPIKDFNEKYNIPFKDFLKKYKNK